MAGPGHRECWGERRKERFRGRRVGPDEGPYEGSPITDRPDRLLEDGPDDGHLDHLYKLYIKGLKEEARYLRAHL